MAKIKKREPDYGGLSKARLEALVGEALVDAYGEHEQQGAFHALIEEHLVLPFETTVLGVRVTVSRIEMDNDGSINAICEAGDFQQRLPILDLPLPKPRPQGWEWIEAYRYWSRWQG